MTPANFGLCKRRAKKLASGLHAEFSGKRQPSIVTQCRRQFVAKLTKMSWFYAARYRNHWVFRWHLDCSISGHRRNVAAGNGAPKMTDSVYSTQTVFPWQLTEIETNTPTNTRMFRFMDGGRAVSLRISVMTFSISVVGRVSWVSSGDIQNTRELRLTMERDYAAGCHGKPSGQDWVTILCDAESQCEQLI